MPRPSPSSPLFIYILRCADGSHYTGLTTNIKSRLKEHEAGKASHHTHRNRPVTLEYLEGPLSAPVAYSRERQIKGWSAEKRAALILRNDRRCATLRTQFLATGDSIDAIGGPGALTPPQSAQQLSAMLSFIRSDQEADAHLPQLPESR